MVKAAGKLVDEAHTESTGTRLVVAAARLFRERGYAATTTREISAMVGINKASLYHYMSGKEDLLHGICIESLRRVTEAVTAALESETDPRKRIEALCHAHVISMLTDLDLHAVMLQELRSLTGSRREEVIDARDAYQQIIEATIADAQAAGVLRADLDVKYLTLSLENLLNWTMSWYKPDGELSPVEIATMLVNIYLDGALRRAG